MSLKQLVESHVALIVLDLDKFGETVSRLREGDSEPTTPTAIVEWETASQRLASGRESKQQGTLHIVPDDTLALSDRWTINGRSYATTSIGEAQYGLQAVMIARTAPDLLNRSRKGI